MALTPYPSRPSKGSTDWYDKREAYDEALEDNISAIDTKASTAVQPDDVAGLDTIGWGRAVFIANGGTVPVGTPPYTIVIEQA